MAQQDLDRLEAKRRQEKVDDAYEDWVESTFACPECGARPGEPCELVDRDLELHWGCRTHDARWDALGAILVGRRRSVHTVAGGAFEMSRRRH
jgi:hypothetical protein